MTSTIYKTQIETLNMDNWLITPFVIPMAGAVFCLLFRNSIAIQRAIALASTLLIFGFSLFLLSLNADGDILVLRAGGWELPMGIALVSDLFSSMMLSVSNLLGLCVMIYAFGDVPQGEQKRFFFPLYLLLMMGVNGSFLAGDIFNLYVWFEIMLLSSFVLLALGRKSRQLEGALKYVTLNIFASMLFLSAVGILYGKLGTLNMADLALKLRSTSDPYLINTTAILFMGSFGIKAGLFPVFYWLPASYHTPTNATSAVFAGLLTKVGVYALFRVFTLLFIYDQAFTHGTLLVLAAGTMVTGVFGAAVQFDFKRILSFHIISQIGYMIVGLALMTPLAIAGAIFYLIHHMVVKTNLFLVAGVVEKITGSVQLKQIGGMSKTMPWLAFLFFIPAFSLGGIPPLSGFWAKFAVVKAGFAAEVFWIAGLSLAVGILTLYSMTKIWAEVFWKKAPESNGPESDCPPLSLTQKWALISPIVILALITMIIGLYAQPLFSLSEMAAEQLLNPDHYIEAVMKGGR